MATVGSSEPGCPPCPAASRAPAESGATGTQRHICFGERLHRRSDPEKSSTQPGRKDCDSRRGQCDYPRMVTPWSALLDCMGGQAPTLLQVQFQPKAQFHGPGRSAC
ncbi:hypothetical protein D4764_12G0000170 [Takifugu flavidus]|uniref:Uncharacterized protein n=1 Tax=Takifugu flavidus TaxID=433684 RepID=A0A5C6PEB3_9TELE|nr:hypothetical protein D4764_12G0000170 [Takifugu flavidus]